MNFAKKIVFSVVRFLSEVRIEMKRVNWLTRKEVTRLTVVVVVVSAITGIYLGALDLFFSWILSEFVL